MSLVYCSSNLCHYACSPIFIWDFPHFAYFQEKYSFQILFWSLVGSDDLAILHNTPFICRTKVRSEPIQTSKSLKLLTFFFFFFLEKFHLRWLTWFWSHLSNCIQHVRKTWRNALFDVKFHIKLTAILKYPHWNNGFSNTSH